MTPLEPNHQNQRSALRSADALPRAEATPLRQFRCHRDLRRRWRRRL